jgi:thiamine-phosphate pyrophosphorylase
MDSAEIKALAQAIIHQHSANFGAQLHHDANSVELTPQPVPPALRQDPPIWLRLRPAASWALSPWMRRLAQAWQCQSERTNQFDVTHWPDDPRDFGLGKADPALAFAHCPRELGLYGVLPTAEWVGRMARAGVPTVQLRFKSGDRPPWPVKSRLLLKPSRARRHACSSTTTGRPRWTQAPTASMWARKIWT